MDRATKRWRLRKLPTPNAARSTTHAARHSSEQHMTASSTENPFSLLWPDAVHPAAVPPLNHRCVSDLDLGATIEALSLTSTTAGEVRRMLLPLLTDTETICYRQDILADLVDNHTLAAYLERLLPEISTLERERFIAPSDRKTPLHEIVWRIGQLETYVTCIDGLNEAFQEKRISLRASGLQHLSDFVVKIAATPLYQRLKSELPDLLENVRGIASVTIGVNLDNQLRPVAATLVAIHSERFTAASPSLFSRLFGPPESVENSKGIGPLHSIERGASAMGHPAGLDVSNPLLVPLFNDLDQVLKRASRPVANALQRYARINTQILGQLRAELAFYLGAVRLIGRMESAGLPMCRPTIAPPDARAFQIDQLYNLNLALRAASGNNKDHHPIVTNNVDFGEGGRVFVLTGPNQGGKTTFIQAVGIAQTLAQAGLFVPGRAALISPADSIYTHFPAPEKPEMEAGRLGEEAQRLNDMFSHITAHSLVLLNESLSSTSPGESVYLARDLVRILQHIGARVIFATHLHDLATDLDAFNQDAPGTSRVVSLVALIRKFDTGNESDIERTYEIVPGPPAGHSYARELATRYGISYDQLVTMLKERGVFNPIEHTPSTGEHSTQ